MILAIDPGETTGLAVWSGSTFKGLALTFSEKEVWQSDQVRELKMLIGCSELVVYEEWRLLPGRGQEFRELIGPQVVGMVRGFCNTSVPMVKQTPKRKDIITNDILKAFDLWKWKDHPAKHRPHIRDACRHLLLYMRDQKVGWVLDTIRKVM